MKTHMQNTVFPIYREIFADGITPITLLRRLSAISKRVFLLESVEGGERWGRYSFLGYDPQLRVMGTAGKITLEEHGQIKTVTSSDPMAYLRQINQAYRAPRIAGLPPFTGGLVGYFAYSMIGYAEPKLRLSRGEFPDFDLMLFERVVAFDHLKQKIYLIANVKADGDDKKRIIAQDWLQETTALIRSEEKLPMVKSDTDVHFQCSSSKQEYKERVERAKGYIEKGDIFQVVLSRQFEASYKGSLLNAYRVLRTTNPSPYMVYLNMDGDEIISTSPETLVRLDQGRLTTFPVAGSRPRGKTEAEDLALEQELLSDEKELAEHNMLVDLGRNDLGKISQYGSVDVTEYMMVHRYSKVMHICSQVESQIRKECDGYDAIEAVLPAGTLSGAPKIRACEIIEELEQTPRGIYGGALGYLDFTGNMDTCIAIRMAVKRGDRVFVQAGGGIVADSVAEKEFEETENKAYAVMQAVIRAGEVQGICY